MREHPLFGVTIGFSSTAFYRSTIRSPSGSIRFCVYMAIRPSTITAGRERLAGDVLECASPSLAVGAGVKRREEARKD